ncbi:MAG TPA: CHAT domain-containing protein [Acetobacteraceae bacterium]|nr:CHAT domain-containing protein [Acetobacteraceae bacterium]
MRLGGNLVALVVLVVMSTADPAAAQSADPLAAYRAQRDAFIEAYRISGAIDMSKLAPVESGLVGLVQRSSGETRARALLDLGKVQRLRNEFPEAVATLSEAAQAAQALGLRDVAFEAWIGIARAHAYGTSDHGAAATAFEHAVDAAGEQPTAKQRADLADYRAQFEIGRGETEAGIIDALRAVHLATGPEDRFYAELDLADGLQKLANSCDYRPLIDARSSQDGADTYAACRRAAALTRTAYQQAGATAKSLGWTHLTNEAQGFLNRLELRRLLIDQRAKGDALPLAGVFHPRSIRDVLVTREFEAGASLLTDTPILADLAESVVAEEVARGGPASARSQYLLGLAKDIRGAAPNAAGQNFAAAAQLLIEERRGFFDPRRRGTVIENRGEIVLSLALRLLSLGRPSDAFAAFESIRARGLGELASALARPDVTADDRAWLAALLVLEARTGAIERSIVAEMVASGRLDASVDKLQALDGLQAERRAKLRANEAAIIRLSSDAVAPSASLDRLHEAASRAGIPVLLYWSTFTNVIAWYVGPDGSDVVNVFVPAAVVKDKVGRVLESSAGSLGRKPFDETAARELFLYLLAPFAKQLGTPSVRQIMVVPQGPLMQLPFEALIDPASGDFAIDRWAISYAPNATMAVASLDRQPGPVRSVAALVDPAIDDNTNETTAIQAAGVRLVNVTRNQLFAGPWQADSLHILTHGVFNADEALLSSLRPTTRASDPPILAADLVALPLRGLPLAVLSACKGGEVGARISGEIYGFPWALLVGGVSATVLSRWDVNGDSNGRWMGIFYRELSAGASAAVSAATAMRELRKAGVTHPYYWAPMQVSGR